MLKRYQQWWVYVLLFGVFGLGSNAIANLFRTFIGEAFVVPGSSMSPTIQPGDRILVDKRWYVRDRIHRNDVVAFRSEGPDSPLYSAELPDSLATQSRSRTNVCSSMGTNGAIRTPFTMARFHLLARWSIAGP